MYDTWMIVVATVVGVILLSLLYALVMSGGDMNRIKLAARCRWHVLRDPQFAEKVLPLLEPLPEDEKPSGVPLRMLALLQRKGRLVDFLLEDFREHSDEQVGSAIREIHQKCQAALKEHLELRLVIDKQEGDVVEVPSGFDPSAIQVTGNVSGEPPYTGKLRHPGWRVTEIRIAAPPEGQDELVLQPAEVEIPEK